MNYFLADWGSELEQELSCSFPFQKYEGRVDLLGAEQWKTGRAIQIFVSKENILRFVHKSLHFLTFDFDTLNREKSMEW